MESCDLSLLEKLLTIKNIINFIFIIIPVVLLVILLVDIIKANNSNKESDWQTDRSQYVKRGIKYCLLFLVPILINFFMYIGGVMGINVGKCYPHAKKENIEKLSLKETDEVQIENIELVINSEELTNDKLNSLLKDIDNINDESKKIYYKNLISQIKEYINDPDNSVPPIIDDDEKTNVGGNNDGNSGNKNDKEDEEEDEEKGPNEYIEPDEGSNNIKDPEIELPEEPSEEPEEEPIENVSNGIPSLKVPSLATFDEKVPKSLEKYKSSDFSFLVINQDNKYISHNINSGWYTKSTIKFPLVYFASSTEKMRNDYVKNTIIPIQNELWSAQEADPNKVPFYNKNNKNSDTVSNFIKYTLQNSNNLAYMNLCLTYATKSNFQKWIGNVVGNTGHAQYSCWQNLLTATDVYKLLIHMKSDKENVRNQTNGEKILNTIWTNSAQCKTGGMPNIDGISKFNVYNKTGSGDRHYLDMGIVENKNNKNKYFIYIVFTKNQNNHNARQAILKAILDEFGSSIS